MSEPEIARRCSRCGATVRARAQFCPQCGASVESLAAERMPDVRARERPAPVNPESARRRMIVAAGADRIAGDRDEARLGSRVVQARERSAAVLDEAATDPSLRFVLVAALIFVVAIVVLVLSLVLR